MLTLKRWFKKYFLGKNRKSQWKCVFLSWYVKKRYFSIIISHSSLHHWNRKNNMEYLTESVFAEDQSIMFSREKKEKNIVTFYIRWIIYIWLAIQLADRTAGLNLTREHEAIIPKSFGPYMSHTGAAKLNFVAVKLN